VDRFALIEWLKRQPYVGPGFQKGEGSEAVNRLVHTLDRFEQYLAECGIASVEESTLEALKNFDFHDDDDDDGNLRNIFAYLGRSDLSEYVDQVSADKYFRRKKLLSIFKDMGEMKLFIKALQRIGVLMAADLLAQGETPAGRQALAVRSGLPLDTVTRMVHCCDLCRMTGMAGQALRRSLSMGYDSLATFRSADPDEIRLALKQYLANTGERSNNMIDYGWFVVQARQLPDRVQV